MMNLKSYWRKWSWPVLWVHPWICLVELG